MINKNVSDIKESDIDQLVTNSISESKTLEFKKELKLSNDEDKREFLSDFSAFANTSGGDLVYGVEENDQGIAKAVPGISVSNIDKTISKIENLLRDCLDPRVAGHQINHIDLKNSNIVLIITISKSWNSPHRVTFRSHDKFYARNSKGKYPMDVHELRSAFTLSNNITKRIQDFLIDRIIKIENSDTSVKLDEGAKLVLHMIPTSSMLLGSNLEFSNIKNYIPKLSGIITRSYNHQYNLEGFMTYNVNEFYVQVFKTGIIESVQTGIIYDILDKPLIPSSIIESGLIRVYDDYLEVLKYLNVGLPIFCFVTFIGVEDVGLAVAPKYESSLYPKIRYNKSILRLADSAITDFNNSSSEVFKPIFDSMWNAYGFEKSANFSEEGEWIFTT